MAVAQPPAQAPEQTRALTPMIGERNAVSKIEQVIIQGDLKELTPDQRVVYYQAVCESVGLNPLTKPFEYLSLNGKLVLYATKGCTEQLRAIRGIEITSLERERSDDLAIVVAHGRDASGRQDTAMGATPIKGIQGEALANALLKAETKAKRRLTLSLGGLGLLDEIEVDSVPGAWREDIDATTGEIAEPKKLADRLAAQAAAVVIDEAPTNTAPSEEVERGTGAAASSPADGQAPEVVTGAASGAEASEPVAEAKATTQCEAVSPYGGEGRCGKAQGHTGNHANRSKETWT